MKNDSAEVETEVSRQLHQDAKEDALSCRSGEVDCEVILADGKVECTSREKSIDTALFASKMKISENLICE